MGCSLTATKQYYLDLLISDNLKRHCHIRAALTPMKLLYGNFILAWKQTVNTNINCIRTDYHKEIAVIIKLYVSNLPFKLVYDDIIFVIQKVKDLDENFRFVVYYFCFTNAEL